MTAKETVLEMVRRMPDDVSMDEIVRAIRKLAASRSGFPVSEAGLPMFDVPPGAPIISSEKIREFLDEEFP